MTEPTEPRPRDEQPDEDGDEAKLATEQDEGLGVQGKDGRSDDDS